MIEVIIKFRLRVKTGVRKGSMYGVFTKILNLFTLELGAYLINT